MDEVIEIDGARFIAVGMKKDIVKIEGENYIADKVEGRTVYRKVGKQAGLIEINGKIYRAIEVGTERKIFKAAVDTAGKVGEWIIYGGKDKKKPPRQPRKRTRQVKAPVLPDVKDPFPNSGGFQEPKFRQFGAPRWDPSW